MYDAFSLDYDRFVSWPGRLAYEIPFLSKQIQALFRPAGQPVSILDTACGTGMHAIALAASGYACAGADLSTGMVERARANAAAAGVKVPFVTAGFGSLQPAFSGQRFDVLLCLGNSLPHLLSPTDLALALADFAHCLQPGGLLLIQNRNFDAVMNDAVLEQKARWMEPQATKEGETEWLFFRFYDFEPDGLIAFNIATLRREAGGSWQQRITTTHLRPLLRAEMLAALASAGFGIISCYGGMEDIPFDPANSGNLVITALNRD